MAGRQIAGASFRKPSATPRSSGYGIPKPKKTPAPKEVPEQSEARAVKPPFTLPALSIPLKKPPPDPMLERLKKKTVRRNAPEGEDLKKIREVIKSINREVCSVQEYVGMISPYTGDGGNALRSVMGDDLASFRRMAKQVYDTMTQDVSDVLANEQIHMTNFYTERYTVLHYQMMRTMDEIHRYVPDFNFDLYYKNATNYLKELFPISAEEEVDPEEEEMQKRQLLYHRLEWLRTEGTRLNDENRRLQNRLKTLKQQQREELVISKQQEEMVEVRKNQLEAAEANLQNQLEELNESVHKSIAVNEESMRVEDDGNLQKKKSQNEAGRSRSRDVKSKKPGEPWSVKAAKDIEKETFNQTAASAISSASVSVTSSVSKETKKKKGKSKFKKPPPYPRDTSPFHYSPPKATPRERSDSPFHYSPPQPPLGASAYYGPPKPAEASSVETVAVESTTSIVDGTGKTLPPPRRNRAPRDSWGGF